MDWNDMSSDDDDSWVNQDSDDDDDDVPKKQAQDLPKTDNVNKQENQVSETKQEEKTQNQKTQNRKNDDKKNERPKKTYPTDAEILADLEAGKIEEDTKIKVVNCFNEEQKQYLQNNKLKSGMRQFKQNSFVVYFKERNHLEQFIKEKIEKKFRFKLGIYYMTAQQKQQQEKRRKERRQNGQRKQYKNKDQYQKDRRYEEKNTRYRQKNEGNDRREKQRGEGRKEGNYKEKNYDNKKYEGKNKYQNHKGNEKPGAKGKDLQKNVSFEDKNIILKGNQSAELIVDGIAERKYYKKFARFKLTFPLKLISLAEEVATLSKQKHNFGLVSYLNEKDFDQDNEKLFEFTLEEKKQPAPYKRPNRSILVSPENYFEKAEKLDCHVVPSNFGFSEKEYYEQFKKNYSLITKNNTKWSVKGLGKNVQKVLRLHSIFSKNLGMNKMSLSIGMQNGEAFVCTQIGALEEQIPKARGKPDTSMVNNYLNV